MANTDDHQPHPHLHDSKGVDDYHVRGQFGSRLGFILAAAGSAVGLGNIWKFPYMTGENGGSAFIILYLICVFIFGLPVMLGEFVIGRATQTDQVTAYSVLSPGRPWGLNGLMGLLSGLLILSFYCPVAGWMLCYGVRMATGGFDVAGMNHEQIGDYFNGQMMTLLQANTPETWYVPIIYMLIIAVITGTIILMGVESGVERACKILMPALFILMLLMIVRSLTLPNIGGGLSFLFKPDFGKISWSTLLSAMGMAFFSLSLAMGAMMTYASYVDKKENLVKMALSVTLLDTAVALLAGLMIFPAVFSAGLDPNAGPGLVMQTLPVIFMSMPLGKIAGTIFFLLLTVAAITSSISLMEPIVTWLVDGLNIRRGYAAVMVLLLIVILAIPVSLSVTGDGLMVLNIRGLTSMPLFDVMSYLAENVFMPLGAIIICMFLLLSGWKRSAILQEAVGTEGTVTTAVKLWYWTAVTITPLGILFILLNSSGLLGRIQAYFAG